MVHAVKKSQARMPSACDRRNGPRLARYGGARGDAGFLEVAAAMRRPGLAGSPAILL
jgi:hypothetical protein